MKVTFSNGFELDVSSVVESRSFTSESSLSIGMDYAIDIDEIADSIKGGLDVIVVDQPAMQFKRYTRLLSIQNIINEESVESTIRLARENPSVA